MARGPDETLVSTDWLAERLDAPDLRVVDATWFLPDAGRDARGEHEAAHIPGAVFVEIEAVSDPDSPLPHMLPPPELMASRMRRLGLGDGNRIVVYDNNDFIASARLWWQLRVFGHGDVVVLDGGLKKWAAEGRPVTDEPTDPRERHFTARVNTLLVRELDQMRALIASKQAQIVDTRGEARFAGEAEEPRPDLRPGHMPGAINLPASRLVDPASHALKTQDGIRATMREAGVDPGRMIVATCGSGVSACVVTLALHRLGVTDSSVYDGSWAEWGGRVDTPVVG